MFFLIFAFFVYGVDSRVEKYKFDINCLTFKCKSDGNVCGIRQEGKGYRLRIFQDECAFLNYKCATKHSFGKILATTYRVSVKGCTKPKGAIGVGYDAIDMNYCSQVFHPKPDIETSIHDPCKTFDCFHPADNIQLCGLREDGEGFRIRVFRNKCELWEHNCENNVNFTITDFHICNDLEIPITTEKNKEFQADMPDKDKIDTGDILNESENQNNVVKDENGPSRQQRDQNPDKSNADNATIYGNIYISGEFNNDLKNNNKNDYFTNVDYGIANDYTKEPASQSNVPTNEDKTKFEQGLVDPVTFNENIDVINDNPDSNNNKFKNIVLVRELLQEGSHVNETISKFFSATHVFDLPIKEMPTDYLNETTRRRLVKIAGPIKVYIPQHIIPKNVSDDMEHRPTLHSCFHKCPRKCPPTYAPVCGVPGRIAREPSLMFLNHCFMDVAQCKQFWENKSPTSVSSAYTETTFVFCLGDAMNNMYHFLPLVKTLQHMGRLPKKGRFHYRLSNLKFFNNLLSVKNPNLMG